MTSKFLYAVVELLLDFINQTNDRQSSPLQIRNQNGPLSLVGIMMLLRQGISCLELCLYGIRELASVTPRT